MKGEEIKETISNIIEVPKIKKDETLVPGTFDLLFDLEVRRKCWKLAKLQRRRRLDIRKMLRLNSIMLILEMRARRKRLIGRLSMKAALKKAALSFAVRFRSIWTPNMRK